jgi:SAM-dependent methyltransferase
MTTFVEDAPASISAVEVFEAGLSTARLWAQGTDGSPTRWRRLPISDWVSSVIPGDASILSRCLGPTLDMGCGPGRLVSALAAAGHEALGIDVSAAAVGLARAAGADALQRCIFGPVPGGGLWRCALLADGNIGIGGDPHALLVRAKQLLAPAGVLLVELASPGTPTATTRMRLRDDAGRASEWFPWASVGVDAIGQLALHAGFAVQEIWDSGGRWFARLVSAA